MNDTHMSHAMEFAYPQSMANCVTCHEGKLDVILADKFFTLKTCKSCHPMDGVGGTDSKRAPALNAKLPVYHPALTATLNCGLCHSAEGGMKTLKQVHTGYDKKIYTADGKKFSESFKVEITGVSLAGDLLTVKFKATEATDIAGFAVTDIAPTVMVAPYGWDTKDWAAGYQNWALPVVGVAPTAKVGWALVSDAGANWEVTLDLATGTGTTPWPGLIAAGTVKRLEVAIRPVLKTTFPGDTATTTLALDAVSKTFDVKANSGAGALVDFYGAIVEPAKCNACHDALATTFHSADRGGSVVVCRMCHTVRSGGGHLEMQSRSIDSYVHAIHSMQPFDTGSVNFADPVAAMRYDHHVESTYPNFTTLNCESCHNPGTYEAPTMDKSLPGLLSKSYVVAGRSISNVPSYVVGPASRACGACHRAELINEDEAGALAAFNQHTATFGTLVAAPGGAVELDAVTSNVMAQIAGGATPTVPAPAGTQIESCSVCHPNAGAEHQAAYKRWQDGL
jgi:OmcA/MtrC family decaheme c-type cytochrome